MRIVWKTSGVRRIRTCWDRPSVVWAHAGDGAQKDSRTSGVPWSWSPEADLQPGDVRGRFLAEAVMRVGSSMAHGDENNFHRLQLRREDFVACGFTGGCLGCQAMSFGTSRHGHVELCRRRMEEAIRTSPEGQIRVPCLQERENDKIAEKSAWNIEEENAQAARKKARAGKREEGQRIQRRTERPSS